MKTPTQLYENRLLYDLTSDCAVNYVLISLNAKQVSVPLTAWVKNTTLRPIINLSKLVFENDDSDQINKQIDKLIHLESQQILCSSTLNLKFASEDVSDFAELFGYTEYDKYYLENEFLEMLETK